MQDRVHVTVENTAQVVDGGRIQRFVFAQLVDGGAGNVVVFDQGVGGFAGIAQGIPKGRINDQSDTSHIKDGKFLFTPEEYGDMFFDNFIALDYSQFGGAMHDTKEGIAHSKRKVECEITLHSFLVFKHAVNIANRAHVIDFFHQSIT